MGPPTPKTISLCKNAENMAVYLSPQKFAVMNKFLKHSFFLQMLIEEIRCFLEKRSLAHHVSIYSV